MTAPTPAQMRALAELGPAMETGEYYNVDSWIQDATAALCTAADQLEAVQDRERAYEAAADAIGSDHLTRGERAAVDAALDQANRRIREQQHEAKPIPADTAPQEARPPVLYCGRVPTHRSHHFVSAASDLTFACPGSKTPLSQDGDSDDEEFCARCFAGVDSSEHHEKCVTTGHAEDGESASAEPRMSMQGLLSEPCETFTQQSGLTCADDPGRVLGSRYGATEYCWPCRLRAVVSQQPSAEPCCDRPGDPNWHTIDGGHVIPPDVEEDTPVEPPRIEHLALGTTFRIADDENEDEETWTVDANRAAVCSGHGVVRYLHTFNPSTIRDVTPPA